jgi:hypothetical protein
MPDNEEITINEDELVGFIIRKAYDYDGLRLEYEEVRAVLDLEQEYLKNKGIAKDEN